MKRAIFDEKGFPTAFYDEEINTYIPEDTIEIEDEQWQELIDNPNLKVFKKGEVVDYIPTADEIEKKALSIKISEAQTYLNLTDHKFYGDYEPHDGEDMEGVKAKRKEAREFIRANKG